MHLRATGKEQTQQSLYSLHRKVLCEKLNLNTDKLEIPFHITEQFFAFKNIFKTGFI